MNSISEKEKKLLETLDKLKNLENLKPDNLRELEILYNQKNQLQIEKKELQTLNATINSDYVKLKEEISKIKQREKLKESEFSEKIDELNQETDTLLEEIDKWQT